MSDNKDDTLRQFGDVTGADETRSRFFLESANWQLDVALSSFFEHGGNLDEGPVGPSPQSAAEPRPVVLMDSDMESTPSPPTSPQQKKDKKKSKYQGFATLNTLRQDSSSDEEEGKRKREVLRTRKYFCDMSSCISKKMTNTCQMSSSSEHCEETTHGQSETDKDGQGVIDTLKIELERLRNELKRVVNENDELKNEIARLRERETPQPGQAFYAGGSERSGQQIIGPGKNRKDIVAEMFKSVRERGAVVFEDEPATASRGRGAFSGVGYRLGQTSDDHEPVSAANPQSESRPASRSVRLRLYREGFTVDDGALRRYSDPQHAEFLRCIRQGEIPPELSDGGGEVRVSLEDRRMEDCPKNIVQKAFDGQGHLLGSPTPPVVGATVPLAASPRDREANHRAAQDALAVDEAQPTTTVQFRLADGSRLVGRFNTAHTVADLARYLALAEPHYQTAAFSLLTSFPSAELQDQAQTLQQAGLLNTTLLTRLK